MYDLNTSTHINQPLDHVNKWIYFLLLYCLATYTCIVQIKNWNQIRGQGLSFEKKKDEKWARAEMQRLTHCDHVVMHPWPVDLHTYIPTAFELNR